MTEQPNEQNNNNEPTPQIEKLLIETPQTFSSMPHTLFTQKHLTQVTDAQAKKELNQNLEDLKANKID